MRKCTTEKTAYPFVVLIMDWTGNGTHWIKGVKSLKEAQKIAQEKCAEHQDIINRLIIIEGTIQQIGAF